MKRSEWFRLLASADSLHLVQQELDYWISEGGDPKELERLMDLHIDLHTEGVSMWKHLPVKAMDHLKHLNLYMSAKLQWKQIEEAANNGIEEEEE